MIRIRTMALGLAMLALTSGAALAQDAMKSGAMSKPMSKHDMKMMKSCQAMDHDKMMANKGCMKMMKMHPGMMSSDGAMKSDGMMKH